MFIGREAELKRLQEFKKKKIAGIVAVSGKKYIGKSALIEHFAQGMRFLEFQGLSPREKEKKEVTTQNQLDHCRYALYVCEIKCNQKISPEVIDQVADKIHKLSVPKAVSIRPVLIYEGELPSKVSLAHFFTYLLSFEQILIRLKQKLMTLQIEKLTLKG